MEAVSDSDVSAVEVGSGATEMVEGFTYLFCQLIVKQLVTSSVGLPKHLKLLAGNTNIF